MSPGERLLDRFSSRIGWVITGRQFLFIRAAADDAPLVLPATFEEPPPALPPMTLPPEARDGLTTRRHLAPAPRRRPIVHRGEITDHEAAEKLGRDGLLTVQPGGLRSVIRPSVVVAAPIADAAPRKRVVLDVAERAGARRTYLVDYVMACAIGLDREAVTSDGVRGVLALEADWFEYGVISYADLLCTAAGPWGADDILHEAAGVGRGDITRAIAEAILLAHDDLREPQTAALATAGILLCGAGALISGLAAALAETLALPVTAVTAAEHPAITGLRAYLPHLPEWTAHRPA